MATFKITGPDGAAYTITAPDEATDDEVLAFAQSQLGGGAQEQKPLSWSDVPGQAIRNIGPSARRFGEAVAQPFMDPVGTAKSLTHLAAGVGSKMVGGLDSASEFLGGPDLQTPEQKAYAEAPLNAVGRFYADRYGSVEGLKNTLATDPVGVAADAAAVLYGGGAMLPGRVGTAVKAAGSAVDPVMNTVRAGKLVAKGSGKVAAPILGMTTGAQTLPIEKAYEAGRRGSQTFVDNLRGTAALDDVVTRAEGAVNELVRQRGNQYQAWNPLPASQATIDLRPLNTAVADGMKMGSRQGVVIDRAAASVMDEISNAVKTFQSNGWTKPADLDQLKQIVYDIGGEAKQGSRAHKAAMGVYHAIGKELKAQVPGYAETMKDYAKASDLIKQMRKELSINSKATGGTTLRKLQSSMRSSANTGWGERTRLVDELAKIDREIPYALAGQSLASKSPRGIQSGLMGSALGAGGVYAAMTNPLLLAGVPATIPHIVGEGAYALGRSARAINRSPVSAQQAAQAIMLGQLLSRSAQASEQE